MCDDATGAAGRQRKTSKLQNCLMMGYPGYRSGEVIMRLRGANKMRSVSHYRLVCFVLPHVTRWCGARRILSFNFLKMNVGHGVRCINLWSVVKLELHVSIILSPSRSLLVMRKKKKSSVRYMPNKLKFSKRHARFRITIVAIWHSFF